MKKINSLAGGYSKSIPNKGQKKNSNYPNPNKQMLKKFIIK